MLPDIANRLNNLSKALESVIVPAIPDDNPFAREQAALMLGHLKMISEQWDFAYLYERGSYSNMLELAERLHRAAEGGPSTLAAGENARTLLAQSPEFMPLTVNGVNGLTTALGKRVDDLIRAAYVDGSEVFRAAVFREVLSYNRLQATRERTWFKSNGLDPDSKDLGGLADMLLEEKFQLMDSDSRN